MSLTKNERYCVSFFINIRDISSYGIDRFDAFFTDDQIDTVNKCTIPLTYYIPQISNTTGNIITDTLNWIKITGVFKAAGNEKHVILGNFSSDLFTDTTLINTSWLPNKFCDINLDDVSCIPLDLPAYAGPDKSCKIGDSVYIGRELDFAIDPGCTWYKLPNMLTPFASSVSGLWVKQNAASTSTYVVKQILDCSALKYDTVVVYADLVGIEQLIINNEDIVIFPNPAGNSLQLKFNKALVLDKISFLDILGKQCLVIESPKTEIDISSLQKGLYYLHVETKDGTGMFKVVKE